MVSGDSDIDGDYDGDQGHHDVQRCDDSDCGDADLDRAPKIGFDHDKDGIYYLYTMQYKEVMMVTVTMAMMLILIVTMMAIPRHHAVQGGDDGDGDDGDRRDPDTSCNSCRVNPWPGSMVMKKTIFSCPGQLNR